MGLSPPWKMKNFPPRRGKEKSFASASGSRALERGSATERNMPARPARNTADTQGRGFFAGQEGSIVERELRNSDAVKRSAQSAMGRWALTMAQPAPARWKKKNQEPTKSARVAKPRRLPGLVKASHARSTRCAAAKNPSVSAVAPAVGLRPPAP
jgi:hypothetical protein